MVQNIALIFVCLLIITVINTLRQFKTLLRLRIIGTNLGIVEQEMDLLERACDDAVHVVNQFSACSEKLCNTVEPQEKKKMAVETATKFAIAYGVSKSKFCYIDDMIEAILGSNQKVEVEDDDPDED